MIDRQTIYIAAYPKSGSTWLTRLLGDVLNSPTGGCMPSEDSKEVATEGQDRLGPYVVRKGHFVLVDVLNKDGLVVPKPHRLAWQRLTTEKIVFLVRDPRDICISGAWHWRTGPADFLDRMIKGNVAKCGRWDAYVSSWFNLEYLDMEIVNYWHLLKGNYSTVDVLLVRLGIGDNIDGCDIRNAIKRQSFAARKAQIGNDEKELRRNNMRKGIVGDWRNHFTKEMNDKIWSEFGWVMERLGYEY